MTAPATHQSEETSVKKHPNLRRPLAVLAALALGSTVLLGVAPGAQAAPVQGQFLVETDFGVSGAPGCSLTSDTSDTFQTSFTANGAAKSASFSSVATVEDAGDAADDTSMTAKASGRVRATQVGGSLDTLTLTATLSARVDAAQGSGSDCDSDAEARSGFESYFTLAESGWVRLRGVTRGGAMELQLASAFMGQGGIVASYNIKAEQTRRFFLSAGTYVLYGVFAAQMDTPDAVGEPTSMVGGGSLNVGFTPAGDATGPAAGGGKAFVKYDGALSCGARSLSGRFTNKAAKVKTATFFVNGKRAKVVRRPGRGADVVLRGLPVGSDVTVKAVLKLKQGGAKSVTRSYASCS